MLPAAALVLAGCASSVPVVRPQVPGPRPQVAPAPASELRIDLEKTYDEIVKRETLPGVDAPQVDLEAAVSIPIPEHRTINSALNLFTTDMREDIQTSLLRCGRYRKMIETALAQYRLPKGLAYLPVIESAYLPLNTSRSGAYGIWQFMPDTAKEYGRRVD